jgi:hypothetical protein
VSTADLPYFSKNSTFFSDDNMYSFFICDTIFKQQHRFQ